MKPHRLFFTPLLSLLLLLLIGHPGAQAQITDFSTVESLPVQERERQRPFYTFATENLQSLTGRATFQDADATLSPMQALFSLWADPQAWLDKPFILVKYGPLRVDLGLNPEQKRFSIRELSGNPKLAALFTEVEALEKAKTKLDSKQAEIRDVAERLHRVRSLLDGSAFAMVPPPGQPAHADQLGGLDTRWLPPAQAATAYPGEAGQAVTSSAQAMLKAYQEGDNTAFQSAASAFSQALANLPAEGYAHASSLLKLETFYQKLHPFGWAGYLYALAAIVLGVTSIAGRSTGYKIAWGVILAGAALQLFGFTARILIGGRGPVTNMYESVIWVAFLAILFALILEGVYRSRLIFLAATPIAFVLLTLADKAPTVLRPSIDPLNAVLRDNFWLSTHVTSITAGYGAFILALGVGHIILFKVLFGRPVSAALYNYLYRAMQIGVLLLAIGTLLGAVWANFSWGRFWDWDPKETWALIALLGYIALLHGRIAGWWKGFGLAIGSVIAFLSVLMAWYGVNFVLGEGFHSYGFGSGGIEYVSGFVALELVFVALVLLKVRKQGGGRPAPAAEPAITEP